MKKTILLLLSLILTFTLMPSTLVFAADKTVTASVDLFGDGAENVTFSVTKDAILGTGSAVAGEVTIGDGTNPITLTNSAGEMTLPSSIRVGTTPYNVVGISANAFSGFSELTKVYFSDTINNIGANAFLNCTSLDSVIIPSDSDLSGDNSAAFPAKVNLFFNGNYNENYKATIDSLPAGSNIYIKSSATGWDTVESALVYDLSLTVVLGSANKANPVAEGDTISITASNTDSTKTFVRWTTTNALVSFADENASTTTITMPDSNLQVNAVYKTTSSVVFPSNPEVVFDNSAIEFSDLSATITGGEATVEWLNSDGTALSGAPSAVGSYKVRVSLAESADYAPLSAVTQDFSIIKGTQSVSFDSADINIPYDALAVELTDFNSKYTVVGDGTTSIEWYNSASEKLSSAPTTVGDYKIGITVLASDSYNASTEVLKDFSIIQAKATIVFDTAAITIPYDGTAASSSDFKYTATGDGALMHGWYSASNPTVAIHPPVDAGSYIVEFRYEDGVNYSASEKERKEFTITPMAATGSVKIDRADTDSNSKVSSTDVLTANVSSVSPAGATLSYQWKLNGTNISGATSNTYTVPSGYTYGNYTVLVTATGNYSGSFTSSAVGEVAPAPAATAAPAKVYNITSGTHQTSAQNKALSFQTDIHHSDFAGIWVDGISRDVNTIATITEGNVKITLKTSFLNTLSLGEHLISFIAKDGAITSTYFTLTAPVVAPAETAAPTATPTAEPTASPEITPQPVPEAAEPTVETPSQTDGGSIPILPIAGGLLLLVGGIVLIIRRRNAE